MENKFKLFINENKGFVVFYLLWFLLHLILVSIGGGDSDFWPFEYSGLVSYGLVEFIFYLIVPVVLWGLWKLIGKDVKKSLD